MKRLFLLTVLLSFTALAWASGGTHSALEGPGKASRQREMPARSLAAPQSITVESPVIEKPTSAIEDLATDAPAETQVKKQTVKKNSHPSRPKDTSSPKGAGGKILALLLLIFLFVAMMVGVVILGVIVFFTNIALGLFLIIFGPIILTIVFIILIPVILLTGNKKKKQN